jgi:hypothetical protein
MILTRRQFLVSAAAGALVLPLVTDELLHPGRKIFLPPRKVFTGDTAVRVAHRSLIEHSYIGGDGRFHRSQFWVRSEDVAGMSAAITEGVIKNLNRHQADIYGNDWLAVSAPADTFESLPVSDEKLVKLC